MQLWLTMFLSAVRLREPRSGVAQTSESAVSQISKSARAETFASRSNVQRALSPHPSPLPWGEGETDSAFLAKVTRWIRATPAQVPAHVRPLFPLPEGEGQGEGERDSRKPNAREFASGTRQARVSPTTP